jgi:hypothetical protein
MDRAALDSLDREGLIAVILRQVEAIERLTGETGLFSSLSFDRRSGIPTGKNV